MKTKSPINESVGIDISKLSLDVFIHTKKIHKKFPNNKKGFSEMIKWAKAESIKLKQVIWCFENTGWYGLLLGRFLFEKKLNYSCINSIEIKRAMGLNRGKTDKKDAEQIARFAWLRKDELERSQPTPAILIDLQGLMSYREQLVKQSTSLKNLSKSVVVTLANKKRNHTLTLIQKTIKHLQTQIIKTELESDELIKSEALISKNYKLSRSVKGVGRILATQMILHTHNYTRFHDWRRFSSYCGMAPFPYQSGTSVYRRTRLHSIGDKKMKSLLSMSAISAIQADQELKDYFMKRVKEGKPKMLVLNIIRNKIVSRIFATVKRGTPFVVHDKSVA